MSALRSTQRLSLLPFLSETVPRDGLGLGLGLGVLQSGEHFIERGTASDAQAGATDDFGLSPWLILDCRATGALVVGQMWFYR